MAKKTEQKKQTWNEISGMIRVFGNEVGKGSNKFVKYSLSLSKKMESGEYTNCYLDVKFCKDAAAPEKTGEVWYDINNAFFTVDCYTDRNGKQVVRPILVITEGAEI